MTTDQTPAPGGRLRRLLVCFDGSEESSQAIELALDLGRRLGAELTLFSVLPDASHLETSDAESSALRTSRAELSARLGDLRRRAHAEHVRLVEADVIGGDPAERIAAHAAEHGFDLVVIGSHGRERATHGGGGRVVERLVRDPHCPLLIVPVLRAT